VIYLFEADQLPREEAIMRATIIQVAFDAFDAPVVAQMEETLSGDFLVTITVDGQQPRLEQSGPPPTCPDCGQSFQTWSAHHEHTFDHARQSRPYTDHQTDLVFLLLIGLDQHRETRGRHTVRQAVAAGAAQAYLAAYGEPK
jgi:hypothetical protein